MTTDAFTLAEPPLFTRLKDASTVLIAGAGGGFDVYAGLPLAVALRDAGKAVHLANFSFVDVDRLPLPARMRPGLAAVTADLAYDTDYFPEYTLACWLRANDMPDTVYAFARTGVAPLRHSYQVLAAHLDVDAVVLVDGGTDILLRGDEDGLGTPEEDMASLAAVAGLRVPTRIVVSLGFGVDAYHGVSHAHVLENLAALDREGHYLGAVSIPRDSRPGRLYLDAVDHAQRHTPLRPSIVHGSIGSALRGRFGDVHVSSRTSNSELFVNPLMSMYFAVDLAGLAARSLYLPLLKDTQSIYDVMRVIQAFHADLPHVRQARPIPH